MEEELKINSNLKQAIELVRENNNLLEQVLKLEISNAKLTKDYNNAMAQIGTYQNMDREFESRGNTIKKLEYDLKMRDKNIKEYQERSNNMLNNLKNAENKITVLEKELVMEKEKKSDQEDIIKQYKKHIEYLDKILDEHKCSVELRDNDGNLLSTHYGKKGISHCSFYLIDPEECCNCGDMSSEYNDEDGRILCKNCY